MTRGIMSWLPKLRKRRSKYWRGPLDDPQLRSLAESLKTRCRGNENSDTISFPKPSKPNSELEGTLVFFGKYSGDLGAKNSDEGRNRDLRLDYLDGAGEEASQLQNSKSKFILQILPPTYKELHGFIGYSKARHSLCPSTGTRVFLGLGSF